MILENITVLGVLSVTATISTITLFFCGIPICINIHKRGSTKDISGAPFLMGVLGASYWLRYGLLKMDYAMITVNVTAVTLMTSYLIFYFFYTSPKLMISIEIIAVASAISFMVFLVQIFGIRIIHPLGFACMTFNILNFGAPLAGLRVVLRQRSCETLPLPLCIANFAVSSQWCLYGVLISDIYLIIPNGIGMTLALIQLALFVIFPMKEGKKPLAQRLCGIDCTSSKKDVETGKVSSASPMKKQQLDVTVPLIKTDKLKEAADVEENNTVKKSWITSTIGPKDLGAIDDVKKESKPTSYDAVSLDNSAITDVTDFARSSDSALRKHDETVKKAETASINETKKDDEDDQATTEKNDDSEKKSTDKASKETTQNDEKVSDNKEEVVVAVNTV